tara:strand:+ start:19998 stop:21320 length:1323 start_codon:yes stop_codon:yes gene_type:complete
MMDVFIRIRCFLFFIFLLFCQVSLAQNILKDIRISSSNDDSRIVIDLHEKSSSNIFSLENPDRLVIDLKNTKLKKGFKLSTYPRENIINIRFSEGNGSQLRLVIDLSSTFKYSYFNLPKGTLYDHRLVVDLKSNDSPIKNNSVQHSVAERKVVVVIDPGHGGKDPGAIGPSKIYESNVVLAISLRLAEYINRTTDMKAVLTRDDDTFIVLRDRMKMGRESKADLFLSIHADALDNPRVKGASVYTLSLKGASDEAARVFAERENAYSSISEVAISNMDKDAVSLLTDLSQNFSMKASKEAAGIILNELSKVGSIRKKKVQEAGFAVLKSPDVPSVLIETTYISNPNEEARLNSRSYQDKLARAIFDGTRQYFFINPPKNTILANRIKSGSRVISYRVKRGDTLSEIAELYGIRLSTLKSFNGISGNMIRINQTLQIPIYK